MKNSFVTNRNAAPAGPPKFRLISVEVRRKRTNLVSADGKSNPSTKQSYTQVTAVPTAAVGGGDASTALAETTPGAGPQEDSEQRLTEQDGAPAAATADIGAMSLHLASIYDGAQLEFDFGDAGAGALRPLVVPTPHGRATPTEIANVPGRAIRGLLMRIEEVLAELGGFSRSWLYLQIKRGVFPRSIRIGARGVAWEREAVLAFIASRK